MSGILVVAEHIRGTLADISGEMIALAHGLRDKIEGPIRVLIVGKDTEKLTDGLNYPGVDEVLVAETDNEHFDAAVTEEAAFQAALLNEPSLILAGHSSAGMSVAPGLAIRLGSGFATDVFSLDTSSRGLVATRSGYGAKVNIEVDFPGKAMVVMTIRGATFKALDGKGGAKVLPLNIDTASLSGRYEHVEFIEAPSSGVDIAKADFIMSVGRGIQDEKNIPRFAELATKLGATLGCSRPIADSGWLHKAHQVGLTGKVAANCKLYIAVGISGAVQHLHGMKHVETVIAINTDANAPIFNVATYGATIDVFEFSEALEALL
jgi:electron transfer flavoprotein alpha subunit